MAEETRLIIPIGRWVLEHALHQMATHFDPHASDAPGVAINVSTYQLVEDDFVDHLQDTLATTGLSPARLCLEITETTASHDAVTVLDKLRAIRELGVSIALDDFGTGSSSLSLLRRFPIDEIKIDRSFVATMLDSSEDADLVRLIAQVAHALGMRVTAEGVEHAEQADALIVVGCDHAQGYHYARPGPLTDAMHALRLVSQTT
jgi:EAL domain-containing protein (putative c-di-GMP-specific phosphodiesterase class I)